jgi:hypothetical protein
MTSSSGTFPPHSTKASLSHHLSLTSFLLRWCWVCRINRARRGDTSVIAALKAMLPRFKGNVYTEGNLNLMTREGPAAVKAAIAAMEQHKPVVRATCFPRPFSRGT